MLHAFRENGHTARLLQKPEVEAREMMARLILCSWAARDASFDMRGPWSGLGSHKQSGPSLSRLAVPSSSLPELTRRHDASYNSDIGVRPVLEVPADLVHVGRLTPLAAVTVSGRFVGFLLAKPQREYRPAFAGRIENCVFNDGLVGSGGERGLREASVEAGFNKVILRSGRSQTVCSLLKPANKKL